MKALGIGMALAVAVAWPLTVWAEDDKRATLLEDEFAEDARPEPAKRVRVLEDPYQISSFYRSSQASEGRFYVGYGREGESRYPIASFYRQGGEGRYSRFWSSNGRGRTRHLAPRGRHLGAGEVYLFAPTILAPAYPIAAMYR